MYQYVSNAMFGREDQAGQPNAITTRNKPANGEANISAAMTTAILPATPIFGAKRSEMTPPKTQPRDPAVAGTQDIQDAISITD